MLTTMQRFMAGVRDKTPAAAEAGTAVAPAQQQQSLNANMQMIFMPEPLMHPSKSVQSSTIVAVSRYGRIYKRRKTNDDVMRKFAAPPGFRYCTFCRCVQPLSAFYTKVKRYVCIRHHVERVGKYFNRRCIETDNLERYLDIATEDLLNMCPYIGYKNTAFDMKDMAAIISQCGIPLRLTPRAVPIDPSIPMRPRNVAIISRQNMIILSRLYLVTNSRAAFIWFTQSCNLIPRNADPGVPENVFHDPSYAREDIDIVPMLQEERGMPEELPMLDTLKHMQRTLRTAGKLSFKSKPKRIASATATATTTTAAAAAVPLLLTQEPGSAAADAAP